MIKSQAAVMTKMNTNIMITENYRRELLTEWLNCRKHIRLCMNRAKNNPICYEIAARRRERARQIELLFSRKTQC